MNEDKISSYTNLKVTSTVHISQSTYLETMFHTSLQLQFTYLTMSIIFVEMCLKNNIKKDN